MAQEIRDASGALVAWQLSHSAQQVDNGIDAAVGAEQTANRVTGISAASTNAQYPTAKAVYDYTQALNAEETSY